MSKLSFAVRPGGSILTRASSTRQRSLYTTRAALCAQVLHLGRRSGKDAAYDAPVQTYVARMRSSLRVEERWVRADAAVTEVRRIAVRAPVLLLHETGPMPRNSAHFSELLYDRLIRGGSRVAFVIGDDDGIPQELLNDSNNSSLPNIETLSLSSLTLTHKMVRGVVFPRFILKFHLTTYAASKVRLFFVEQLYRATQIRANTKYHR